jgi:hypothetical protein
MYALRGNQVPSYVAISTFRLSPAIWSALRATRLAALQHFLLPIQRPAADQTPRGLNPFVEVVADRLRMTWVRMRCQRELLRLLTSDENPTLAADHSCEKITAL